MKKVKRIIALIGVIILVGMYLITFILGLTASPATTNMLMAAIVCTVIIPCLLYGMTLLAKVLGSHENSFREEFEDEEASDEEVSDDETEISDL